MASPTESTEDLPAQAAWVRSLARHLVRDPERAEDLLQDTWVAALRRPPRASGSVGPRDELDPHGTFSSSHDAGEDLPPQEPEWVVEVDEQRTSRYVPSLPEEQD